MAPAVTIASALTRICWRSKAIKKRKSEIEERELVRGESESMERKSEIVERVREREVSERGKREDS